MLGKKYIKLNDILIPNPTSFAENYTDIENVGQAESGTDLVSVTRLQKRSWALTFNCSSLWLENLKSIGKLRSTTMVYLGESITVRARLTGATLAENSEMVAGSNGYWTVSMTITEV